MTRRLLALLTVLSTAALADDVELKPAQEEAKDKFDKGTAKSLAQLNEKCGTKVTLESDFEHFNGDEWKGTSYPAYCSAMLDSVASMCGSRPAYQKVLGKQLTQVACLFSGVVQAEKGESSMAATLKNLSFEKGVLTFHMQKGQANIEKNTRAVLEKALN